MGTSRILSVLELVASRFVRYFSRLRDFHRIDEELRLNWIACIRK